MDKLNQFETTEYDFVTAEKVHIVNHHFGHNQEGEMDVWIESSEKGMRFLSQLTVQGEIYAVRKEIYTKQCYILRASETGRYWFLDRNASGFWLQNESFFGAQTFTTDESLKIENWIPKEGGQHI